MALPTEEDFLEHAGAERPQELGEDDYVEVICLSSNERRAALSGDAGAIRWSTVMCYRRAERPAPPDQQPAEAP